MRWKISPHFHFRFGPHLKIHSRDQDPRTIDMLALVALLALVLAFAADITVSPAILSRYRVFGKHSGLVGRQRD